VSVLGPPELSIPAMVRESLALHVAIRHAVENRRDPVAAVSALLARHIWPECLAENLGHDYPGQTAGLDRWARAGFGHGTLDVLRGRDARPLPIGVTDDRARCYLLGYLAGRNGMTPS
jgi:hypothetical protein